jgi:hypothetical protein
VREDISLCARAKLLGDRSEIADDDDTAEQYEYSSFARARAKKHQIFFSEKKKKKKKNTREERIQTFFSFPRTRSERTRKKKNKEIKRDFQALPKEERTTPFLLLLFVLVSLVLLLLLHLSLLACTRLLFATAPAFRGHRSAFIVIIILYIFVLFVYYLAFVVWGSKISLFLSFSFSETTDRQTRTHSATTRVREIHDEREVKVLRALLFSFLSSQKRCESFVS